MDCSTHDPEPEFDEQSSTQFYQISNSTKDRNQIVGPVTNVPDAARSLDGFRGLRFFLPFPPVSIVTNPYTSLLILYGSAEIVSILREW